MIEMSSNGPIDAKLEADLKAAWLKVLKRTDVGFPQIPEDHEAWSAIERRAAECRPAKRMLILGIGGSSLGTQVINQSLRHRSSVEVSFLESPDPHTWATLRGLQGEEWKDKHIVIVSKSGNTLETLAWVELLGHKDPQWLKNSQVTVIASPGKGPLQTWAEKEKVATLWIPSNVGGRFSVLTAVAMFPAAVMGLNVAEFREGARSALTQLNLMNSLSAEILKSWQRGEWITQMWTYSEGLRTFGEWWQQLWGESLGKKKDRSGAAAQRVSTPMPCAGPRDQHSLVQQLMEGERDKFVLINRVQSVEHSQDKFKATIYPPMPFHNQTLSLGEIIGVEALAFEKSLKELGIHSASLRLDNIGERTLGEMFMLWQMVTAQLGEYLNIDAFDQPGVEIGKRYAQQILRA